MSRSTKFWHRLCLVFTILLTVFTGGCAEEVIDTSKDVEQAEIDPYIFGLAERFWDDDVNTDVAAFNEFASIIDNLNVQDTEELVQAIDIIAASKNPDPSLMKSANVHVYWDTWPSGRNPSSVWVTTSCGGDNDVGIRYYSVWNAYNNPSHLWFETNSAIVYGYTTAHGNNILAYDINTANTVSACVGVGSGSYSYVNFVKNYFWGGLSINSW